MTFSFILQDFANSMNYIIDEFHPEWMNDALRGALGNREHPDRVRGLGRCMGKNPYRPFHFPNEPVGPMPHHTIVGFNVTAYP